MMGIVNGFKYPEVDGYTIRKSMKLSDELGRKFPLREVEILTLPDEIVKQNMEILKHNAENPNDRKPLVECDVRIVKKDYIQRGIPNFESAAECCECYCMFVNASPEVKDGIKHGVDSYVMLEELDEEDKVELIEKLSIMLSSTRKPATELKN